ncbi:MAG: efflux RND transporter periplasmic adaptor subunit [Puniceicoccales bacterium]|jgi:membrane fusion protein (multidrug efflux system)|nr:efflux RND transporter periplasmic adaptor subunit [Puniceicoccales bacterium]
MRLSYFSCFAADVRRATAFLLTTALLSGGVPVLLADANAKSDPSKPPANATGGRVSGGGAPARAVPPGYQPEVGVITLKAEKVPLVRSLPGRIKPVRVAQVRARVPGVLQKQVFRDGTDVKEGDSLFEIDPSLYEARVASAKASVAQAEANIERAEANFTQAGLLAKRYRELAPTKAVSQQELDNAVSAEAQAKADRAGAKAGLLAAKAALQAAELDLGYTKVRAPISGRIGRPFVTEGALVGQGEVTPLAEINQLEPVYVDFVQAANELSSLKQQIGAGTDWNSVVKVTLLLDNNVKYKFGGKPLLSEITVEPSTASVTLRVEFPNPDWILWPGMYVWGSFEYDSGKPAFLLPTQAVIRDAKGAFIYTVVDGKLVPVPFESNETNGSNWVVRNGLKEGTIVVVDGNQRIATPLAPGVPVKTVPWKNAPTPPAPATAGKTQP